MSILIIWVRQPVLICCSMRIIRSIGIPGVKKHYKKRVRKTSRYYYPLVMRRAIGVMSWRMNLLPISQLRDLMNQWFINIKVDREERPDLDKIYQTAHQLLTGRAGGWPLTVFLTPDKQIPFYAGTYFPLTESFGRPGFKSVLTEVAHFYYQRRDAITRIGNAITAALDKIAAASCHGVELTQEPLKIAREELEKSFDFIHGGFGRAPKFPLPTHLATLLESGIPGRPDA